MVSPFGRCCFCTEDSSSALSEGYFGTEDNSAELVLR